MTTKYSTAKSAANARYREKNWNESKCVECAKPIENLGSPRCELHRRKAQVRMIAHRHFMKDFK